MSVLPPAGTGGGGTGTSAYTDTVAAGAGFKPVQSDTRAAVEAPDAYAGQAPKPSDRVIVADTLMVTMGSQAAQTDMQNHAGGSVAYADTVSVSAGAALSLSDRLVSADPITARAGYAPNQADVYKSFLASRYYDTVSVRAGVKTVLQDVIAGQDTVFALWGGLPVASELHHYVDAPVALSGSFAALNDARATQDALAAKSGFVPASLDAAAYKDNSGAMTGVRPSAVESLTPAETVTATSGAHPVSIDRAVMQDASKATMGSLPAPVETVAALETPSFTAGAALVSQDTLRGIDVSTVLLGTLPSDGDAKRLYDTAMATGGSAFSAQNAGRFVDTATGTAGAQVSDVETPTFAPVGVPPAPSAQIPPPTPDNLIEACRVKVKATLTEVKQVVESLDAAPAIVPANLPYVVLNANAPQDVSSQYAVSASGSQIVIDFIYVAQTANSGAADTAQDIRARLDILLAAFRADYHLGRLVTLQEVQAVPSDKANQYAQIFAKQGATILMVSIAFTQVQHYS